MSAAIVADGLTKRFKDVSAVNRVSMRIDKGEIYGFIGLNGAGKTTTIRMLLGMIRPTEGRVRLLGRPLDSSPRTLWARVGYMVETSHSYPDLTVEENLDAIRRLRRIDDPAAVDRVIERFGLSSYRRRKAGALSMGNRQRLGLAKALIHDPEIAILDEPTNGLDPAGIAEVRQLLRELAREKGVTVFLSSHLLSEVARIVDRIGIIHEGRLVEETRRRGLEGRLRSRLVVATRDNKGAGDVLIRRGFEVGGTADFLHVFGTEAVERPEAVTSILAEAGLPPTHLVVEREGLEQYFLRVIGTRGG